MCVSFNPRAAGGNVRDDSPCFAGVNRSLAHTLVSYSGLYGLNAEPPVPSTCQRGSGRLVVVLIFSYGTHLALGLGPDELVAGEGGQQPSPRLVRDREKDTALRRGHG